MRKTQPDFSIIVPTYDRPVELAACLESLANLDRPRDCFEVIVVDDGGTMPLETVIAPFKGWLDIRPTRQPHKGPAAARNTGAAQAQGEFLAFTDDDCCPAVGWLQTLATRFATEQGCMIGGRTLAIARDNPYSTASELIVAYLHGYYNSDPNHARFLTSNNLALPTALFHTVGGFDTAFSHAGGEDREFCDRWLNSGYRIIYAPDAVVRHNPASTFRAFWRQQFSYGRGAYRFRVARARRDQEPVRLEPLSFYLNLPRHPLARAQDGRAAVLALLLVISQIANAAGFLRERLVRSP